MSYGKEFNMSYKITITNNETREVLVEEKNAVAIIGAMGNEQGARSIVFADCDIISLDNTILATENVISKIKRKYSEIDESLRLIKIIGKKDKRKEVEE